MPKGNFFQQRDAGVLSSLNASARRGGVLARAGRNLSKAGGKARSALSGAGGKLRKAASNVRKMASGRRSGVRSYLADSSAGAAIPHNFNEFSTMTSVNNKGGVSQAQRRNVAKAAAFGGQMKSHTLRKTGGKSRRSSSNNNPNFL